MYEWHFSHFCELITRSGGPGVKDPWNIHLVVMHTGLVCLQKLHESCTLLWVSFAGFALSSVEGRVAMEFFDLSEAGQAKK